MKLESLKNGKFSENVLSKASLAMLNGGRIISTANGADSNNYYCCGDMYDCTETHNGSHTVTIRQATMFQNTTADDYLPDPK